MTALQKVLESSGIGAYKMYCEKYGINPDNAKSLIQYFKEVKGL
jgi:hypothetical protein